VGNLGDLRSRTERKFAFFGMNCEELKIISKRFV
jgi:hypothetical protein